ncbi:GDSL family lipase [Cohnella sp. CBP 2801]|uniref:GDSL family lipase n=1 Tax=Cohnella zeiphila TaxID=2761120 RepID=A0A7X0VYQ4_9BACL|nr:GDSL-type esterase/lipase family protein [Cohnella zeiphila]MBB6735246.1 GDSL family lipase [Cohnella zeiphila]
MWPALGWSTVACSLLLLLGFVWALRDTWHPSAGLALSQPSAPPVATGGGWADKPQLLVAALGDSLTRGTGDETGDGYVKAAVNSLQKTLGKPVKLINNLAVNGLTAAQLVDRLDQKGFQESIAQADLVLMTIGGNDLFQIAQNGGSVAFGGDVSPELLKEKLPGAEPLLDRIFAKLRKINPYARIVYVGLYNPFYDVTAARSISETVLEWNDYAHRLATADGNMTVVPTYDLFESNGTAYLSSDHFHPNDKGYQRIAVRIVQALQ